MTDDELKRLLDTNAAETRRHFDVAVERLEKRFDALAETVAYVDEKLDRTSPNVRCRFGYSWRHPRA